MASANRFALLDDDEPKVAKSAPVAAPPPAAVVANAPKQNQRGGDRSKDKPYRPKSAVDGARADGETNPRKREWDGHHSRTEFRGGRGGRGRGDGRPRKDGYGRGNVGANPTSHNQSAEVAIEEQPAAIEVDGETPAASPEAGAEVVAEPKVEEEEEDKTITLAQFLANKVKLEESLNIRRAGEDVVEEDFQEAREFRKKNTTDVLGAAAFEDTEESATSERKLAQKKNTVDIDIFFAAPASSFRGRGGRGGSRGGYAPRGGYSSRQAPVAINDTRAFPTLGK